MGAYYPIVLGLLKGHVLNEVKIVQESRQAQICCSSPCSRSKRDNSSLNIAGTL